MNFSYPFVRRPIGTTLLERTSLPYVRGLRLLPATSYDLHLAPKVTQFRLDVRMTAERLARIVGMPAAIGTLRVLFRFLLGTYELVLISLLMQIGLAMPMAYPSRPRLSRRSFVRAVFLPGSSGDPKKVSCLS